MTTERFVFIGCLIPRWLDPLPDTEGWVVPPADRSEMRRYRGVYRLNFSSTYLMPDARPPAGRLAVLCERMKRYEDLFEYIADPDAAIALYRELREYDRAYELIGCAVEEQLVVELQSRSPTEMLGYPPDEDDKLKLENLKRRLLARPLCPPWPILGYDVSTFGHSYSPVYLEVLGGNFPEYARQLNSAGLFPSASLAAKFVAAYRSYPHGEPGNYYVYEVRVAPVDDMLATSTEHPT